jgi:hypothetical protein
MRQLVFPCGASHEVPTGQAYPFTGAHVSKNGSMLLLVGAAGCAPPKLPDGNRAPCAMYCLKPGRHVKEQLAYESNELVWIMSCHGRLYEDGIDVTPPLIGRCPHCEKKRKYLAECVRAAKSRERLNRASQESGVISISSAKRGQLRSALPRATGR